MNGNNGKRREDTPGGAAVIAVIRQWPIIILALLSIGAALYRLDVIEQDVEEVRGEIRVRMADRYTGTEASRDLARIQQQIDSILAIQHANSLAIQDLAISTARLEETVRLQSAPRQ